MPTREDMNSAGEPFLALRREPRVTAPEREIINAQSAGIAARDIRIMELEQAVSQLQRLVSEGCAKREAQAREISGLQESASALRRDLAQARELLNEMQTVAIEWQSVAEDKQRQIEALRRRSAELEMVATEWQPITKAERAAFKAIRQATGIAVDDAPLFGNGMVLINPDGSTERVQPVGPAKPGADMTVISHWVDGKPLRPHAFNSFTHICEACGLTEEEALHPGTIRGCAG